MLRNRLNLYQRGSLVKRYHTCNTIITDTVGRHSAGVAFLCWELTGGRCGASLLAAALIHDTAEAELGDLPAPTKRKINNLHDIELDILSKAGFSDIDLTEDERRILKLADCIEGMLFCHTEINMGNRSMCGVYANYCAYAGDMLRTAEERNVYYVVRDMVETSIHTR